jgi:hypothetical protein
MDKLEMVGEFRRMINAQTFELIDVQKAIIKGDDDAFDKIQSVITSNSKLWEELWNLEHPNTDV